MPFTVQMPALGESVTEGTVTRWLKAEGDRVEVNEPLLEVSTDKVDTEIPSPAAGVLKRIVVGEDETVEVGGALAVIGEVDASPDLVFDRDRWRRAAEEAPVEPLRAAQVDQPAAGWYVEQRTPELLREWDGAAWTGHTRRRPDTVFVSYARADEAAVREIVGDLLALRLPVWRDEELEGGEPWWEEILRQIRAAAVFLHAVSDAALSSEACRAERDYADALGIPVVPVQVATISNIRSRLELLRQMVDLRKRDVRRGMRLAAAIRAGQQRRDELPEPLPEPPDVPFPYLVRTAMNLAAQELSFPDQQRIFWELRRHLADETDRSVREEICALLCRLRDRDDAFRATSDDITWLLKAEEGRG